MKKQRFFKILALSSLLVMIFAAAAAATAFNPHVIQYVLSGNSNTTISETHVTDSGDSYMLIPTGTDGKVTISLDINGVNNTKTYIVSPDTTLTITWDVELDSDAAKFGSSSGKQTFTTTITGPKSADLNGGKGLSEYFTTGDEHEMTDAKYINYTQSSVTLNLKSTEASDRINVVRVRPTFEGSLLYSSGSAYEVISTKTPTVATTNSKTNNIIADVYYKIIDVPTFTTWSKDLDVANIRKAVELSNEDTDNITITVTSGSKKIAPFTLKVRTNDGITENPLSYITTTNKQLIKDYNLDIAVSGDYTNADSSLGKDPRAAYWITISGDGSVATPTSGIALKVQLKNAKKTTGVVKTLNLIIPANTPAIRSNNSTYTSHDLSGGMFSQDVPVKKDIGSIQISADMNLPITWTYNLPSGLKFKVDTTDNHIAYITGSFSTEEEWNMTGSEDIWVRATNANDTSVVSTDYFGGYPLRIGAIPKLPTVTPGNLTTGTPYSTTITLEKGKGTSWDVVIYSGDVGDANKVTQFMAPTATDLFKITSDEQSVTIVSSNDQALRYTNSKKKFIARVFAYNPLITVENSAKTSAVDNYKDYTINVTPTAPTLVEGTLPTTATVGDKLDNVFLKFDGALPMILSLDITADTKNNPGITDVSKDLGLKFSMDKGSDDILIVSTDGFRNATKALKVNVIGRNPAQTSASTITTFTMTIAGTAPVFSDDQDITVYALPKAYITGNGDFDNVETSNATLFKGNIGPFGAVSVDTPNASINWDHVKGTGPLTITAKGNKSPVVYTVGSLDLYGTTGANAYTTTDDGKSPISGKYKGLLSGRAPDKGKQTITITAQNTAGKATKKINIIVVDDPVISTKKELKKLTVGKAYKGALKSKAKDVTWKLEGYNLGDGFDYDNASADLYAATGLLFDEETGAITGTVESYPGATSIDLKVSVKNILGREASQDFRIPLVLSKPKLNVKGKIPDLYAGTEMEEAFEFTAETAALSGCVAPKLPTGLELVQGEVEEGSTTYTYSISGTPEAATMTGGKVKAAKVEIILQDMAGTKVTKNLNILVHPQALTLDEEYTADTMEATATQTFNIELPGEGDQSYKWSIKAAKGYEKVKGLKAAINKGTKTTKDNGTLKIDFTTKKSTGGTGTFELIGKNAGDSKLSVSALVSVTVNEATDSAEALKDKDNAEALKDAAEGNEATEATESTSKTETEAADAADAKAEAGITVGGARGESSLTANEKKALEGYVIAAVLPEVTVTEDGQYDIEDVQLKEEIPAGAKLEWFAFPRSASKGDEDIVDFTDNNGAYTDVVPEDHVVTVSPWFNADVVYAPVIAVKADEVNDDDEAKTEE